MATAYIGLGSNLGDRQAFIKDALGALAHNESIHVNRVSEIIETAPLSGTNQPKFLNAVAEIQTSLDAQSLYHHMATIEDSLGREQKGKKAPRTIDLDLLLYDDQTVNTEDLTVPHSQMHLRSFVLKGLCELNPSLIHPALGVSVGELAARLNARDFALDPEVPQLVSIAGIIGVGKTTLATKLSKQLNAELLLEPYDTNPFLPKVYAGRKDLALHSQLYFLLNRTEQLNPGAFTPAQLLLTDYIFEKDLIYARQLLDANQLYIYEKLYPSCAERITKPVLVVYLQDTSENCLERIHRRNRPYEQKIEPDFLTQLDDGYQQLFDDWHFCPLIRLSMQEFDCANETDVNHLANQIKAYTVVHRGAQ